MLKAGQIVVIPGHPKIYEVRGPARISGDTAVAYSIMGADGRGFQDVDAELLRLATPDEIGEGRRLIALEKAAAADEERRQTAARIKAKIDKHRGFLIRRGIIPNDSNTELAAEVLTRELRVTHCYSCYATISNEDMIECQQCRWIVCECGACGCGHPDFGARYINERECAPLREASVTDEEQVAFVDFSAAVEFIKDRKEYSLSRDGAIGWLATKRKPMSQS